jgi:hypothetical protein
MISSDSLSGNGGDLACGSVWYQKAIVDFPARVMRLADEYVREYIARNPETATFEGLADAPDRRLSDNSLEALK